MLGGSYRTLERKFSFGKAVHTGRRRISEQKSRKITATTSGGATRSDISERMINRLQVTARIQTFRLKKITHQQLGIRIYQLCKVKAG